MTSFRAWGEGRSPVTADAIPTLDTVADLFRSYRLPISNEATLHRAIAELLASHGVAAVSEYDLGPGCGRIDFFVPALGLGIELKVKGSLAEVTAQLHRYAGHPDLRRLILVTGRIALGRLPRTLRGKPVDLIATWRGAL